CAEIGRVTDDGMMRVRNNGSIAAEIPAKPLADEAPLYSREARQPTADYADSTDIEKILSAVSAKSVVESLRQLLRDPTIASKNWVYRQYDHTVRTGNVVKPGSDAGVFFVRYANKILAATTDCNSLYCRLDPRQGARIAVAEAARNLTCSGAKPLAVTDNLNFGNPYKPENFWQLRESVEGMAEACRAFGTPITGGNVSLYNESQTGVIDPTPTVGMVGLIAAEAHITTQWFKAAGDAIILVGGLGASPMGHRPGDSEPHSATDSSSPSRGMALQPMSHRPGADATMPVAGSGDPGTGATDPGYNALGASRFLKTCFGLKQGPVPALDLDHEIAVQNAVRDLIGAGLVRSAHDCSEGGLAVAVAECCFNPAGLLGAQVNVGQASSLPTNQDSKLEACATLFAEIQSRIVISVSPPNVEETMNALKNANVPGQQIGTVGGEDLLIRLPNREFRWPVAEIYDDWWNSIRRAVEQDESIPSL
ncbi:MAG TPA: AIR synthase related protein, partial [Chthoniobacterales bacterium]|nr:AIR synthase related protein [Chthoniobacterales bacterium]